MINGRIGTPTLAVILAAGMGTRIDSITKGQIPKGFLSINGKTLVERSLDKLRSFGITQVIIVTGHLHTFYDDLASIRGDVRTIYNPQYASTGSMASLAVAANEIHQSFFLLESDLIYEDRALESLIKFPGDSCVLLSGFTKSGDEVWVETKGSHIFKMSKKAADLGSITGELTGVNLISASLLTRMMECFHNSDNPQYHYEYAITDAGKSFPVEFLKINDLIWAEIDDANHLARVERDILPLLKLKNQN